MDNTNSKTSAQRRSAKVVRYLKENIARVDRELQKLEDRQDYEQDQSKKLNIGKNQH